MLFLGSVAARLLPLFVAFCLLPMRAIDSRSTDTNTAFQGMRLGETTAQLLRQYGRPAIDGFNEHATFWSYRTDNANAWRVAVIQDDKVTAIYVRQSYGRTSHLRGASGVALGENAQRLLKNPKVERLVYDTYSFAVGGGLYWLYEISAGTVTGIGLTRSYDFPLPPLSTYDYRDGETPYQAMRLVAADSSPLLGARRFLKTQTCDYSGTWTIVKTTAFSFEQRRYSRVLARCSRNRFFHNFYFDVSAFTSKSH